VNRRTLLQMLSGAAISPLLTSAVYRPTTASTRPRGPLGLNLTSMNYWETEQPFSNLAINASRWSLQVRGTPFTWKRKLPRMTPDGYPRQVPKGYVLDSFLIFTPHRRNLPVELSVFYDGKGRLGYVDGGELEARAPGRDDIRNLRNEKPLIIRMLETDPDDPIRNIRVYERGGTPKSTFRKPFLDRLQAMAALRFMDWMATNDSVVRTWDDRPRVGQFGKPELGVPLEYMTELCNLMKIEPWFNMPHLADDDYIRLFAEQVRRDLDPKLDIHVEYSNEVWNGIFDQAGYAREQGLKLGFSKDDYEAQLRYYAHRTNQILAIWEDVFGKNKQRIIGIYAAQFDNDWTSTTILDWPGVKQHADVLAVAPYFGGGLGSPSRADEVSGWSLSRLFSELNREIAARNKAAVLAQADVALRHGVKLYAYEGGQHLAGHGGAEENEKLTKLFVAANRDPRMGELYLRHFENWWAAGGELYAVFASMGEASKWGSWGLLEFEGDSAPKWQAIQKLVAG
jgi:hypothetical protein